jgi:hypothetical protein
MKEHSLDPETRAPTPRTKAYIATGEWDAKERIGIRLSVDDNCAGRIGTTSASPSGVDRFCGKLNCTIAAHQRSRVAIKSQCWYIQADPRSPSGLFASPSLPAASLGGPIPKSYEACVSDSSRQLDGLTLGQWKFLLLMEYYAPAPRTRSAPLHESNKVHKVYLVPCVTPAHRRLSRPYIPCGTSTPGPGFISSRPGRHFTICYIMTSCALCAPRSPHGLPLPLHSIAR